MVIKQLVLKKRSHYFFNSSVLLKDFDKNKITQDDCVDRSIIILTMQKLQIMSILCI